MSYCTRRAVVLHALRHVLPITIYATLLSAPARGQGLPPIYDDFLQSPVVSGRWFPWFDAKKLSISNSHLLVRIKAGNSAVEADLESPDGFQGDFDFVLEFKNYSSTGNTGSPGLTLYLYDADVQLNQDADAWVSIDGHNASKKFAAGAGTPTTQLPGASAPTTANAGQLRLERRAGRVNAYYTVGAGWQRLQSWANHLSNIVYLAIEAEAGPNSTFQVDCDWIRHGVTRIQTTRPYEQGCGGTKAIARSFPYLGNPNFGFLLLGAKPRALTLFILGSNKVKVPLGAIAPGCSLHVLPDILVHPTGNTDQNGQAWVPLPIPKMTVLLGLKLYQQLAVLVTPTPTFTLSNGVAFQVF